MWPIFVDCALLIIFGGIITVHNAGALIISGTLYAFAKDSDGYPFIGKLCGDGILCPTCGGSLRLHNVTGVGTMLICGRTNFHRWKFDPTLVSD
jgi:hypothetical protein